MIVLCSQAQTEKTAAANDSIVYKKKYGVRLGVDLSKPLIGAYNADFTGYEMVADHRLRRDLFVAGELGYVEKTSQEDTFRFSTRGSYLSAGVNLNAYKNWLEMDNELYFGFRYGFSRFSQTLEEYSIFQRGVSIDGKTAAYFESATEQASKNFDQQYAHWASFVLGLKVETFKNLYLGASVNFNKLIHVSRIDNFKNLYIPGFGKVYVTNTGISFNYTLSYRIPLYQK